MKINQRICRSLDVFARQKRWMTECGGRSMVEMLGVLAIIGVLSAGAMAGYSKAMFRHRVNQTIDIFQGVLQRVSELETKGLGVDYIAGPDDLVKYGLLTDCQRDSLDGISENCKLPIGMLDVELGDNGAYISGAIYVRLADSKSCTAFVSAGWEKVVPVEWFNPEGYLKIGGVYETYWKNTDDMNASDYAEACETCNQGFCDFWLVIREY